MLYCKKSTRVTGCVDLIPKRMGVMLMKKRKRKNNFQFDYKNLFPALFQNGDYDRLESCRTITSLKIFNPDTR